MCFFSYSNIGSVVLCFRAVSLVLVGRIRAFSRVLVLLGPRRCPSGASTSFPPSVVWSPVSLVVVSYPAWLRERGTKAASFVSFCRESRFCPSLSTYRKMSNSAGDHKRQETATDPGESACLTGHGTSSREESTAQAAAACGDCVAVVLGAATTISLAFLQAGALLIDVCWRAISKSCCDQGKLHLAYISKTDI